MSTAPPAVPITTRPGQPDEVRVYQHSTLFYWWPVWLVGLILWGVSFFSGYYAVIVPHGTEPARNPKVEVWDQSKGESRTLPERDVLILPKDKRLPNKANAEEPEEPRLHMTPSKTPGVVFAITLLLTILISSVSVRGVWSIVVMVTIILLVVLFALFDVWTTIADWFALLRIHINAAGYGFIALTLLIMWAVNFFIFDRRTYIIFTAGQVRIREAVGQGEKVYDTTNMVFHKQQNDFFRHWIWGLGAGDLEIVTNKGERFDWHNVSFVGYKVRKIERLIKMKEVV